MAGTSTWRTISDATEEILRRQRAAAAPGAGAVPAARARPGPVAPGSGMGAHYAALYAPPPDDLAALRRQQAEFARTTQGLDRQNSWMAIPTLAPFALPAADGIAALALRAVARSASSKHFFDLPELEAWQRNSRPLGAPLSTATRRALREKAREIYARAYGIEAKRMQAEVHHIDPLEWAHLKPGADPNRLSNLAALRREAYDIATREWAAFKRSLEGRRPSQSELMKEKLRVDPKTSPYNRRAGAAWSTKPPKGKGPL